MKSDAIIRLHRHTRAYNQQQATASEIGSRTPPHARSVVSVTAVLSRTNQITRTRVHQIHIPDV